MNRFSEGEIKSEAKIIKEKYSMVATGKGSG
jgi:hypothetical protein